MSAPRLTLGSKIRYAAMAVGATVLVVLVAKLGPGTIALLLRRAGVAILWGALLYGLHLVPRAFAIWRCLPPGSIPLRHVIRVRLSAESIETLTFTGPFLAEPAKGWIFTRRGVTAADAFGAIAVEYLTYSIVAAWLAMAAIGVLLSHDAFPAAARGPAIGLLVALALMTAGFVFAAVSGIGLIAPIIRMSRVVIGAAAASAGAERIEPVERVLLHFLHERPWRLAEILLTECSSHALLVLEIWIVFSALGVPFRPSHPFVVEGAVKFINTAFFFVPGQIGAAEGVNALVVTSLGLPAAAGVTLALIRRIRAFLVAAIGLAVFPRPDRKDAEVSRRDRR